MRRLRGGAADSRRFYRLASGAGATELL